MKAPNTSYPKIKKLLTLLFLLAAQLTTGQIVIDLVPPSVLKENKVSSCKERLGQEEGPTVYFDSNGHPTHNTFYASIFDTSNRIVDGWYGKKTYDYDEAGNLKRTRVFHPITLDSFKLFRQQEFLYENGLPVQEISNVFDINESFMICHEYADSVLLRSDYLLLESPGTSELNKGRGEGERIYYYDSTGRLERTVSEGNYYRTSTTHHRYSGDTTWIQIVYPGTAKQNQENYSVRDNKGRLIETFTTKAGSAYKRSFIYNDQGLLIRIEGSNNKDEKSAIVFEYVFFD